MDPEDKKLNLEDLAIEFCNWLEDLKPVYVDIKTEDLRKIFSEFLNEKGVIDTNDYFGAIKSLRDGRVYDELTREISQFGIRTKHKRSIDQVDILERYRQVPLHGIFLYTSEDKIINDYIIENWGALDSLSGDVCDLHPAVNQFRNQEDAYDFIEKLDILKISDFRSYSSLPGIFFWDLDRDTEYVSFGDDASVADVRLHIRILFEEIRKNPNINGVREAKMLLERRMKSQIFDSKANHETFLDAVILTVLPEEYGRICAQISELNPPHDLGSNPNLYAWQLGNIFCKKYNASYRVAVGMIGRAGTTGGALAAREALQLWRPRYVLFSGIAGGLPDPKKRNAHPKLGDVVIADTIYGYEYGKLDNVFKPRGNWTYRTDMGLLNCAIAYSLLDGWRKRIAVNSPIECIPKVISGEIASGDMVVDDPTNAFFAQVLNMWPKIKAVEMEGAGVASAIEQAQSLGIPTGFMIIRGISDLPRAGGEFKGTNERDVWKIYASDTAAAFIVGWISDGLPMRPCVRSPGAFK